MVSTETLQVVINAKDYLSKKIKEVNNSIKQTGTVSSTSSNQATAATNRIGSAYEQLRAKVTSVWNNIKNTIKSSTIGQSVNSNALAKPFLNAAESIKQRWSSMVETIKSKLKGLSNSGGSAGKGFNISAAGLATLNGQVTTTNSKVTTLLVTLNKISPALNTIGGKAINAFTNASAKIESFKGSIGKLGSKMTSLVSGLSGVQSAIMGAFGAVGVTSLTSFTVGAAIARQKLNAVTTSITGSEAATKSLNAAISKATTGGIIGFTKVAQAVQQTGIKYNLTNKQLEATAPVLNRIGTLARAMGKDSETAATIMNKAYDGLNGNFMLLKRNLGITKEQLLDAGWSGAAKDVDGYTNALMKVLDTKPEMQEYLNSFEGQQERLQLAIKGVGRSIGEIVLPVINTILGWFLEMHKQAPWLTTALVGISIAILGVISVLTMLAPILFLIEEEIIAIELSTMWPLIVVAAVIALIAVLKHLYDTNENVRKIFDQIGNTVKNLVVKAWNELQRIMEPLGRTFNHFMSVLGRLAHDLLGLFGITGDAADNFDWLGAVIKAVGAYITTQIQIIIWLVEVIASVLVPVISLVVNIIANLVNFIISLSEAFSLLMEGDITGFFTVLGNAIWTFLSETVLNVGQMFLEILNNLNMVMGGVLTSAISWLTNLCNAFIQGAANSVNGFIIWISQLPGQFYNWLLDAWNRFWTWRNQIVENFKTSAQKAVDNFISYIKSLPGKFWTWLMNTYNKVVSFAKTLYDKMKNAAKQAVDGFKSYIQQLPQKMWDALMGVKQKIQDSVGSLVQSIKNLAWRLVDGFKSAFHLDALSLLDAAGTLDTTYSVSLDVPDSSKLSYHVINDNTVSTNDKEGTLDTGADNNITSTLDDDKLLKILKEIQTLLSDIHKEKNNNSIEVINDGEIKLKLDYDLSNVPSGINIDLLRDLLSQLLTDKDILKQLTSNKDFQMLDKRAKTKIINAYNRHI